MSQKVPAILLSLALLAAPLAVLARATVALGSDCNSLCCLPHGGHSHSDSADSKESMACHHGTGLAISCSMRAPHHPALFGFLAPIPPTTPSHFVRVCAPPSFRATIVQTYTPSSPGFAAIPFEPPRV